MSGKFVRTLFIAGSVLLLLGIMSPFAQGGSRILWFDGGEEYVYAGSIREYLVEKGYTVTYYCSLETDLDLWDYIHNYDVLVVEHANGWGAVTNLDYWFQYGKGYVALTGEGMYSHESY